MAKTAKDIDKGKETQKIPKRVQTIQAQKQIKMKIK